MNVRLIAPAVCLFGVLLLPLGSEEPKPVPSQRAEAATPEAKKPEAKKPELPDYCRFRDDAVSARLEIAVRSFKTPGGAMIDLIGVVHIADRPYYEALNKRFAGYDAVLFEMVGDPEALRGKKAEPAETEARQRLAPVRYLQGFLGSSLNLVFQVDGIDYTRPNMVHADTTAEEFERLQKARNESMMGLLVKSMKMQLSGELEEEMGSLREELDIGGLLRILLSEDSAAEFKIVFAKMFDRMESMTAKIEGEEGTAILGDRNKAAVGKLKEVLKDTAKQKLAVFYGAAHMPGIEKLLVEQIKCKATGEEWLAAWTMPHTKVPAPKKSD